MMWCFLLPLALAAEPYDPLGGAEEIAWGANAALVRTNAGVVAMSNEHGVFGFVEPPSAEAQLMLGKSAVFAVRGSQLWAADSLQAAVEGEFHIVNRVSGAKGWDATPGLVAALTGSSVWVSTDDGVTGALSKPGGSWARVFVGQRLVVVEDAEHERVAASADAGKTWTALPHPGAPLVKIGGVIASGDVAVDEGRSFQRWKAEASTWMGWLARSEEPHGGYPTIGAPTAYWPQSPRPPDPKTRAPRADRMPSS